MRMREILIKCRTKTYFVYSNKIKIALISTFFMFQITQDCTAQENILNLAYTIGIFSMGFTSFIWGFLLETWGLRIVRILLK